MSEPRIIKSKKISKNIAHVEVEYGGKIYTDTFSISGKERILKKADKNSISYKIAGAMLKAIKSKSKKEDENGSSNINKTR